MKSKLLCVLLALVLVLAAFVSCDNGGDDNSGNNNNNSNNNNQNPGDTNDTVVIPEGAPTYNANWDKTEIKFALTDDNCSGELSSGCKKYYSGTEANSFELIDDMVRARNLAAAKSANVTPRYDYEAASGGWSGNISSIVEQALAGSATNPDIYCNYVYDLSCAQLRHCFANLLDTETTANYFRFNEEDYNPVGESYFDSEAGEGYFYDYMKSMTLSNDKMYLLASNFCTDLVRAFLVVPLNVQMMSEIKAEDTWTGNMTEVSDFYDLVWKKTEIKEGYAEGWTYNVLAHYSDKVYADINDKDSDCVLADKIGFAAGTTSGLVSSGILYTSDVEIIKRDKKDDGSYNYYYPETNENLNKFAAQLTALFKGELSEGGNGIVTIDGDTARDSGFAASGETELIAIRNRFAENKVLFGGVIAVGSLEDTVYQNMRTTGSKYGFGILPVPTYETGHEYLTLVHNIARIIAISKSTTEFAQCSAFLDYQSRMSAEILDEYYNVRLASSTGGLAGEFNNFMLTYIRNHVRDCFDKTFEDSISNKIQSIDSTATENKWHELLSQSDFKLAEFSNAYKANAENKNRYLKMVIEDWNNEGN